MYLIFMKLHLHSIITWIDVHGGREGGRKEGVRFKKFSQKNAIKHEKGDPLRFSDNPYCPLKRIWPKP
jgi:hypothetical protein